MIENLLKEKKPETDILAEERRRRGGWVFWPGVFLSGRRGVVLLVLFLVGGLGWMVQDGWRPSLPSGGEAAAAQAGPIEVGRQLRGVEYAFAEQFGSPLFMGEGGAPVIRVGGTGAMREVTPVEVEYDSVALFRDAGYGDVVWGPGPRGWGLWWKDDSQSRSVRTRLVFTRSDWAVKQRGELSFAASQVSYGLNLVGQMDLELWREGLGLELLGVVKRLNSRYPAATYGHWGLVPHSWGCSLRMESDLTQGISRGCPDPEYYQALDSVWVQLGVVVDLMEKMGWLAYRMDGLGAAELYQGSYRLGQTHLLIDLLDEVEGLSVSLESLFYLSVDRGLSIDVSLFREPL